MREVKRKIADDLSIYLVKTTLGLRPLREEGRDFIKVLYEPVGKPAIYQCFYRSTGEHIKANNADLNEIQETPTKGVWTPCDGIGINDYASYIELYNKDQEILNKTIERTWQKKTKPHILKVDYFGKTFANDNWVLQEGHNESIKNKKFVSSCNIEYNKRSILCRFGNSDLITISYLLSNNNNNSIDSKDNDYNFWKTAIGIDIINHFKISDRIPYNPEIPKGIAVNYITVDIFIETALSFNWIDMEPYKSERQLYGLPYNLQNCIIIHKDENNNDDPTQKSIFEPLIKIHPLNIRYEELKSLYISKKPKIDVLPNTEEQEDANKFIGTLDSIELSIEEKDDIEILSEEEDEEKMNIEENEDEEKMNIEENEDEEKMNIEENEDDYDDDDNIPLYDVVKEICESKDKEMIKSLLQYYKIKNVKNVNNLNRNYLCRLILKKEKKLQEQQFTRRPTLRYLQKNKK
jgi:hypothetical protein